MRIDKSYQTVELGIFDEVNEEFTPSGETVEVETIDIYADEGKVFKRLSDGVVLSNHITVGTMDSTANYIEINNLEEEI